VTYQLELRNVVVVVLVWWATIDVVCHLFEWKNRCRPGSAVGRAELIGEAAKCD
jgi:hypothetical protein